MAARAPRPTPEITHPGAGFVLEKKAQSLVSRIMAITQLRCGQGCEEVQQPAVPLFSDYPAEGLLPWKSWTLPASSSCHISCSASETARQKSLSEYNQESSRALTWLGFALPPTLRDITLQHKPFQLDYPKMFLDISLFYLLYSLKKYMFERKKIIM